MTMLPALNPWQGNQLSLAAKGVTCRKCSMLEWIDIHEYQHMKTKTLKRPVYQKKIVNAAMR